MMSEGDRAWFQGQFDRIHNRINKTDSDVHHLDTRTALLESGSETKCGEAVAAHVKESAAHNPFKALRNLSVISIGLAALGKLIHWILTFPSENHPK